MLFAGVTAHQITRVCVTHFHGDHCLGLPGVLQRMALDQVTGTREVAYPASGADIFDRIRNAVAVPRDADAARAPGPGGAVLADGPALRLEARPLSTRPHRRLPADRAGRPPHAAGRAGSARHHRPGRRAPAARGSLSGTGRGSPGRRQRATPRPEVRLHHGHPAVRRRFELADGRGPAGLRVHLRRRRRRPRRRPRPPHRRPGGPGRRRGAAPAAWCSPTSPSATPTPCRNCCATRPPHSTARSSSPPTSTGSPARPARAHPGNRCLPRGWRAGRIAGEESGTANFKAGALPLSYAPAAPRRRESNPRSPAPFEKEAVPWPHVCAKESEGTRFLCQRSRRKFSHGLRWPQATAYSGIRPARLASVNTVASSGSPSGRSSPM